MKLRNNISSKIKDFYLSDDGLFNSYEDYDLNRLSEKEEEIKFQNNHGMTSAKLSNIFKTGAQYAHQKYKQKVVNMTNALEPEFAKRRRNSKFFHETEARIDKEEQQIVNQLTLDRKQMRESILKKQETKLANQHEIEKKTLTWDTIHQLKYDHEMKIRQKNFDDYVKRQEDEAKRKKKELKEQAEMEQIKAVEAERKRLQASTKYWTKVMDDCRAESKYLKEKANEQSPKYYFQRKKVDKFLNFSDTDDSDYRNPLDITPIQNINNKASTISIYREEGTQYCSHNEATYLGPQVNIFSTPTSNDIEEKRAQFFNLQRQYGMMQQTYNFHKRKIRDVEEELDINQSIHLRLKREHAQNDSEIQLIISACKIPIRRDFTPHEWKSIHILKNRKIQIENDLKKINRQIVKTRDEMKKQTIAVEKSKKNLDWLHKTVSALKQNNDIKGQNLICAPMVIGQNIGNVIHPMISRPLETYDIIVQKSKLEVLKDKVSQSIEVHKETLLHDEKLWSSKLELSRMKSEIERCETKLASKIQKYVDKKKRADINDSILRYWKFKEQTSIPFSEVVQTENFFYECEKYVVTEFVMKTRLEAQQGNLRITNLITELIAAKNSKDYWWDSGILLGTLQKPISKVNKPRRPYMGPKVSIKKRIRDSSKGGVKCFKRYRRENFVKIVENEVALLKCRLQKELSTTKKSENVAIELGHNNFKTLINNRNKENSEEVLDSHYRYLKRKQAQYGNIIDKAKSITGSKVEILDEQYKGRYIIQSCNISWIENGTKPYIKHVLQKCDASWMQTECKFHLDLTKHQHFVFKDQIMRNAKNSSKLKRSVPHIPEFEKALIQSERPQLLEKERWEITDKAEFFYDLDYIPGIYDLFLRHGHNEQNLPNNLHEKNKLITGNHDFVETEQEFGYLMYRIEDSKRKANFIDLLDRMGRINCYRLRIRELEQKRDLLLPNRAEIFNLLTKEKRKVFESEAEIKCIECDIQKAQHRLNCFEHAQNHVDQAQISLAMAETRELKNEQISNEYNRNLKIAKESESILRSKIKVLLKNKIETMKKIDKMKERVEESRKDVNQIKSEFLMAESDVIRILFQKVGQYIPTCFGPKRVILIRERDMMLCFALPFGCMAKSKSKSMIAKVYFPLEEALKLEKKNRVRAIAEMSREDALSRLAYTQEKKERILEAHCMFNEEKKTRSFIYECNQLRLERELREHYWKKAKTTARKLLRKSDVKNELEIRKRAAIKKLDEKFEKRQNLTTFDSEMTLVRSWNRFMLKRKIHREERKMFINEIAIADTFDLISALEVERDKRINNNIIEDLINTTVETMINELTSQLLNENKQLVLNAEKEFNFAVPNTPNICFPLYCELRHLWLNYEEESKKLLYDWSIRDGENYLAQFREAKNIEDLDAEFEQRKRNKMEQDRQEKNCMAMKAEEDLCKKYYHNETLKSIFERRCMMAEEHRMRILLREEELKLQALASKYNVMQSFENSDTNSKKNQRRSEIKRGAADRKKQQKEMKQMYAEDIFMKSTVVNERQEEQIKMLNDERELFQIFESAQTDVKVNKSSKLSSEDQQKKSEEFQKWNKKLNKAEACALRLKMAYEIRKGEVSLFENILHTEEESIKSISLKLWSACKEDIRVKKINSTIMKKYVASLAAHKGITLNKEWHSKDVRKKIVLFNEAKVKAKWMDSKTLTGFNQRWNTNELQKVLYNIYFKKLVSSILDKVDLEVTKRQFSKLESSIATIESHLKEKKFGVWQVWSKFRRHEHLMMYRSALGNKIFGKSRNKLLHSALKSWRTFVKWRVGQKNAYNLRYNTIKLSQDLKNLHNDTQSKMFDQKENIKTYPAQHHQKTYLQNLKGRKIKCKRCNKIYSENVNHSHACCFHPGEYTEYISKKNVTKGDFHCRNVGTIPAKACWSCCGNYNESSDGCQSRRHIPPIGGDPTYNRCVINEKAKDYLKMLRLDKEIAETNDLIKKYDEFSNNDKDRVRQIATIMDEKRMRDQTLAKIDQ